MIDLRLFATFVTLDEPVKNPKTVIPALNLRYFEQRTEICSQLVLLDSRFRGNDRSKTFYRFVTFGEIK